MKRHDSLAEIKRVAAEEETQRQAEEEAKRIAAEEEAQRQAEAEAQRLAAEEEARRQAEEEAKRIAAEQEAASMTVAALDTEVQVLPTQSIAEDTVDFDGDWILEIFDRDDRSRGNFADIEIIDGKFSTSINLSSFFHYSRNGYISGEIDRSGML